MSTYHLLFGGCFIYDIYIHIEMFKYRVLSSSSSSTKIYSRIFTILGSSLLQYGLSVVRNLPIVYRKKLNGSAQPD